MAQKYLSTRNYILVTFWLLHMFLQYPAPSDCVIKGIWPQSLTPNIKKYTVLSFSGWAPGQYTNWVHSEVSANCFSWGHFGRGFQQALVRMQKNYWYKEYLLALCETVSNTHSRNLQMPLLIWLYWPIIVSGQTRNSPYRFYIRLWYRIKWNKQMCLSWCLADWIKWQKDFVTFFKSKSVIV